MMRIGLMSDTHDNIPMVKKAVTTFNRDEIDIILHAGDYISPFVIPELALLNTGLVGVFGNNDGDRVLLTKKCGEHDHLDIRGNFAEIDAEDISIALLHGDDQQLLESLIAQEAFDVIVHGHTHSAEISHHGRTLIINPGEVCGYLTRVPTIAVLDTSTKQADLIPLE